MTICVVGLGKIGLPLAVQFASKGHPVIGTDVNLATVDAVNNGIEPFPGEHQLQQYLEVSVRDGLLTATTDTAAAVSRSDVVVIVVPLFVDQDANPDFGWMDAATEAVGRGLRPGTLVSYETTLPVGTTRNRFGPVLSQASGLTVGDEFHLVFSPERVLTGRVFADLRKYPKLVGGVDAGSEARGVDFYSSVLDFDDRPDLDRPNGVWRMGSSEAAEMAKLAETTYRDVNIALANQFACFADRSGIDVYAVIEACNSQPYSHIHQPGIAVGGHCIPVYPRLYLFNDPGATVVSAARAANAGMPAYAVAALGQRYGDLRGAKVAVLGAAYRGGVKETAFSGVFDVVAELEGLGADVMVQDPLYSESELHRLGFIPYGFSTPVDAVVIQTDHREYQSIGPSDLPGVRVVVDGRGVLAEDGWDHVVVIRLGQPATMAGSR